MLAVLCGGAAIAFLVWAERAAARVAEREDAELRRQIAHLPAEQQARLWATKLRLDAERDLH
jgi:hypothetical protein